MSTQNSSTTLLSNADVEKLENERKLKAESNNEPLEKAKEKRTPGINASLVLLYAVFFTMFTTGIVNIMNCPVCIFIPLYLIAAGALGALAKFLSRSTNKYLFNTAVILVVFDVILHGVATYFVYKNYQPEYNSASGDKYCNRTTYLLAFWILTFQYTLLGLFILLSGCYMLMRGDFKKKSFV
ncbi:uncharacterized protein LOC108910163 isoform X1 [Anoplophora glabripennis]|uniref:uncharacterized protein LOC108910163 isoform X1 n=1 Tax=Anoplophora glabripennis TaxID=217634 RepID=UPI0008757AF4|nr:uncharacterized protein LOC108910163 isoform X1 [Anoplophora glabripennis]